MHISLTVHLTMEVTSTKHLLSGVDRVAHSDGDAWLWEIFVKREGNQLMILPSQCHMTRFIYRMLSFGMQYTSLWYKGYSQWWPAAAM